MVGSIYPIQIYIFKNVHSPTLCPKGTQKPSKLHLSHKCWHDISNTNIYIQLTHTPHIIGSIYPFSKIHIPQSCARRAHRNPPTYIHPPSVGIIYPIQIYIFKNVHSPTLCPKGTQKPSNLHSSPK